jgi:hypothetical protein
MIIVRLKGGLGNQMFQYAAGRSLAERTRTVLKLDLELLLDRSPDTPHTFRDYQLDMFAISPRRAAREEVDRFLGRGEQRRSMRDRLGRRLFPVVSFTEPHFHFAGQFETLPANTYLDGYWQSPRYFERHAAIIRAEFGFRKPPSPDLAPIDAAICQSTSVGVHVRRGDYVGNPAHLLCGLSYFESAMNLVRASLGTPHFFIFSDDPEWCLAHLSRPDSTVIRGEGRPRTAEYDFRLLSRCRHFIVSNSTFAWWAAWLGAGPDAMVIAPTRWFPDSSVDLGDLIPTRWRRLDNA